MLNLKAIIIFALLINFSLSKPLNKNFNCPQAELEKKNFGKYINFTTNIDNIISSSLLYFNISQIYKSIILDKIKIYCVQKNKKIG